MQLVATASSSSLTWPDALVMTGFFLALAIIVWAVLREGKAT